MQVDGAGQVGDACAALGREAPQRRDAGFQRGPGLGEHGPPAAREREDHAGVVLAGEVAQPVRVIERLERPAAPFCQCERGIDEGQREAADRHRGAGRDGVARKPLLDREDAGRALVADREQHLVVAARPLPRCAAASDRPRQLGRLDGLAPEPQIDVPREVAAQRLETVGEVAPDLRPGRVLVVASVAFGPPGDE